MAKPDNSEAINGKKYRVFPGQKDPLLEHDIWSRTFMPQGTVYEEYDNTSDVVSSIVDDGKHNVPPIPSVGTSVSIGELYTDDGNVYRVRQSHNVTIYDPDDIPALFTVYRQETADMDWVPGEQVDVGVIRIENGTKYTCLQAHQTQAGWEPSTALALWIEYADPGGEIPVWGQPAGAHDAYKVGDKVHFPTLSDPVYESLINANVWSPAVYPAGWREI